MSFPKQYENPPFDFSDVRYEGDNLEYTHSDMALRIMTKSLMLQQAGCTIPRQQREIERTIAHVVFELAYRTNTVQEYIEMNRQAVEIAA